MFECACVYLSDIYPLKFYSALYLLRTQHLKGITIYYLTISIIQFFKEAGQHYSNN